MAEEKKSKPSSGSGGGGGGAKASWWLRALCFIIAVLLMPVVIAGFEALVAILRNPDIRTRIFGHSQAMLFFFAGIVAYIVLHLLLPSGGKQAAVEADPGGKLMNQITGDKQGGILGFLPVFLPTYTIVIMILYFAIRVAWPDIENYFSLFTFLVGLTWSYHLIAGFSRLLSDGSSPAIGLALPLVFVLFLNMEVLVGIWSLLFKSELWLDYNQAVFSGAKEMYVGVYDKLSEFWRDHAPELPSKSGA
jgi:hypothetical protein